MLGALPLRGGDLGLAHAKDLGGKRREWVLAAGPREDGDEVGVAGEVGEDAALVLSVVCCQQGEAAGGDEGGAEADLDFSLLEAFDGGATGEGLRGRRNTGGEGRGW